MQAVQPSSRKQSILPAISADTLHDVPDVVRQSQSPILRPPAVSSIASGHEERTRSNERTPVAESLTINRSLPVTDTFADIRVTQPSASLLSESVDHSTEAPTNLDTSSYGVAFTDDFDWNFYDDEIFSLLLPTPTTAPTDGFSRSQPSPKCAQDSTSRLRDGEWLRGSAEAGRKALVAMNRVIQSLPESFIVTTESEDTASTFFEDCLDLFFRHHLTVAPIVHKPTFNPRECNATVLLYILSLGSCFLPYAAYKADSLYLVSHAVMANAWEQLLTNKGPHDVHSGVQLVQSCSLGGTYAIVCMNPRIRKMSHVARGLGSVWARECGLYRPRSPYGVVIPSIAAPSKQKLEVWQKWVAEEVQVRSLLWQYVLDGLSSLFYRQPTLLLHETNSMLLPTASAAFEASTVDAWIEEISRSDSDSQVTVQSYVRALFRGETEIINKPISELAIRVVLECLQSLILRVAETTEETIGMVNKQEICVALLNLKHWQLHLSRAATELLLRWHSVFLSMSVDIRRLSFSIGPERYVEELFHPSQSEIEEHQALDLPNWVRTDDARRAILHAIAIGELVQSLSMAELFAVHMPFTIFSAAAVVAAFLSAEIRTLPMPSHIDWQGLYQCPKDTFPESGTHSIEMASYLAGTSVPGVNLPRLRKISTELSIFHSQITAISGTWGITRSMQKILERWAQLPRGGR
ncbi:hypothetical protein LTR84_009985 [Exophiala bonariae]|uniref:Xylanolytic transcriptional activator regulatory domain-containing protein n=1 Tax=Exophiala bonariae TaxID=1690606 RepID=A0AAV9NP04_9EURO|nr:hypothetical protein LTR84_009985 [Exophiala bonariae]